MDNHQDLECSSFWFKKTLQWTDFYGFNIQGIPSKGVTLPQLSLLRCVDFILSLFCFFLPSVSCRSLQESEFHHSVFSSRSTVCSTVKAQLYTMHCSNTLTLVDPILKPFLLLGTDQRAYEKDKTASWNIVSFWNTFFLRNTDVTGDFSVLYIWMVSLKFMFSLHWIRVFARQTRSHYTLSVTSRLD